MKQKNLYEAWGEKKTAYEWVKDPRCKVKNPRILRERMRIWNDCERALTSPKFTHRKSAGADLSWSNPVILDNAYRFLSMPLDDELSSGDHDLLEKLKLTPRLSHLTAKEFYSPLGIRRLVGNGLIRLKKISDDIVVE